MSVILNVLNLVCPLLQVSLHAPQAGAVSFLPHWLAFPLGFSGPHRLSIANSGRSADRLDSQGYDSDDSQTWLSRQASKEFLLGGPVSGADRRPARLARRSMGSAVTSTALSLPSSPLMRSRSEVSSLTTRELFFHVQNAH